MYWHLISQRMGLPMATLFSTQMRSWSNQHGMFQLSKNSQVEITRRRQPVEPLQKSWNPLGNLQQSGKFCHVGHVENALIIQIGEWIPRHNVAWIHVAIHLEWPQIGVTTKAGFTKQNGGFNGNPGSLSYLGYPSYPNYRRVFTQLLTMLLTGIIDHNHATLLLVLILPPHVWLMIPFHMEISWNGGTRFSHPIIDGFFHDINHPAFSGTLMETTIFSPSTSQIQVAWRISPSTKALTTVLGTSST